MSVSPWNIWYGTVISLKVPLKSVTDNLATGFSGLQNTPKIVEIYYKKYKSLKIAQFTKNYKILSGDLHRRTLHVSC